jgi:hypothetical protein
MMTCSSRILLAAIALTVAAPAFAIGIDAQLLVGRRWAETKDDDGTTGMQIQEITAAGHIQPVGFLPAAIGLAYSKIDPKKEDLDAKSVTGSELGLEAMAWVPLVPIFRPYVKARYVLMGKIESKFEDPDGKIEYETTGGHINAGLRWSPLPLVGILAEVGYGIEMIKAKKIEVGGIDVDPTSGAEDFNSKAILLGAEIAF